MELHISVTESKLRLWAEEAFSSGLGGRGIMKKLQTALDEQILKTLAAICIVVLISEFPNQIACIQKGFRFI